MIKKWNLFTFFTIVLFFTSCAHKKTESLTFDAELSDFQYPFQVEKHKFSSQNQDLQMTYGDLGNKQSKKVIVLLHGKNFSGYYWNQVAEDLIRKNYRVIIPDQIGFGKSSKPKFYQYSFAQLAYNTQSLLDVLKIKSYQVMGHSMGGMLAVHLTQMDSRVQKLFLLNPIGLEDYLQYVEFKDPQFFYNIEKDKTIDQFRNYQKKNYYAGKWSKSYEKLLTPFKGWKNGSDWNLIAWNNALTYSPIFNEEIVSKFKNLKIPTHLILGTRDRTGPGRGWKKSGIKHKLGQYQKLGKEIQKLNPKQIKLHELKGLGHMPQIEDYQRFSKIFLPLT